MTQDYRLTFHTVFARLGGVVPPLGDAFDPLTAAQVREIESLCGANLPASLVHMLLEFGALMFEDLVVYEPLEHFPESYGSSNRGVVEVLLGKVNSDYPKARSVSILHRRSLLIDVLDNNYLPIADDGLGDVICMSLMPDTWGKIFLWDHEGVGQSQFYFVNHSYEQWVASLIVD